MINRYGLSAKENYLDVLKGIVLSLVTATFLIIGWMISSFFAIIIGIILLVATIYTIYNDSTKKTEDGLELYKDKLIVKENGINKRLKLEEIDYIEFELFTIYEANFQYADIKRRMFLVFFDKRKKENFRINIEKYRIDENKLRDFLKVILKKTDARFSEEVDEFLKDNIGTKDLKKKANRNIKGKYALVNIALFTGLSIVALCLFILTNSL